MEVEGGTRGKVLVWYALEKRGRPSNTTLIHRSCYLQSYSPRTRIQARIAFDCMMQDKMTDDRQSEVTLRIRSAIEDEGK